MDYLWRQYFEKLPVVIIPTVTITTTPIIISNVCKQLSKYTRSTNNLYKRSTKIN